MGIITDVWQLFEKEQKMVTITNVLQVHGHEETADQPRQRGQSSAGGGGYVHVHGIVGDAVGNRYGDADVI